MRIISGKYKGKRLIAPKKLPVRPTTDMQKEALFNILNNRYSFNEINVLDLFSGTGNIAYEFASRGTENITCIDTHSACVKYIYSTSKELQFPIEIVKSDCFKFLKKTTVKYDVIFADPPYKMSPIDYLKIPQLIFERELLTEDGVLIVEHSIHTDLTTNPFFTKQRKYGGSIFSFFDAV